jgi:hypothetical protein
MTEVKGAAFLLALFALLLAHRGSENIEVMRDQ